MGINLIKHWKKNVAISNEDEVNLRRKLKNFVLYIF